MILPLIGMAIGAVIGAWRAMKHEGKGLDLVQWGLVGALIGGIIGLFMLIIYSRSVA